MPIRKNELPTLEYLNECFLLDEETGILYWKYRPLHHFNYNKKIYSGWLSINAGKIAGSFNSINREYRCVYLNNVNYRAHRIIFKMYYGYEPDTIDHINGIPHDNRPINLRSVPAAENNKNIKLSKRNTTGIPGVYKCGDGYMSSCGSRKTRIRKYFKTFEEAAEFSDKTHKENGYHENHGR
jgi:hypothetical protein